MLAALTVIPLLTTVGAPASAAEAPRATAIPAVAVPTNTAGSSITTPSLRTDRQSLGDDLSYSRNELEPFVAIGFSWNGPPGAAAALVLTYADGEVTAPIDLDQDGEHGEDTNPLGTRRVSAPVALEKPAVA